MWTGSSPGCNTTESSMGPTAGACTAGSGLSRSRPARPPMKRCLSVGLSRHSQCRFVPWVLLRVFPRRSGGGTARTSRRGSHRFWRGRHRSPRDGVPPDGRGLRSVIVRRRWSPPRDRVRRRRWCRARLRRRLEVVGQISQTLEDVLLVVHETFASAVHVAIVARRSGAVDLSSVDVRWCRSVGTSRAGT